MTTTQTPPILSEVTVSQAAQLLCVSEEFLLQKLDSGDISFELDGNERRIFLKDLLAYKETKKILRMQTLGELVAESQEMGLY